MPVDLRTHDPDGEISIRPNTNKAAIIKLLYRDTNLGYTPAEVREILDIPKGSAVTVLGRLHEEGLIGKTSDGLYHGLDDREDLRRFARSLVSLDRLFETPEPGLTPEDVGDTDGSVAEEIPEARRSQSEASDEPTPEDWVTSSDE